jgi:outer membrane cobalamin receptor
VDNWIQWVIRDSVTPVEYKKVHVSGMETWLEFGITPGPFNIKGLINYNYNRSVIISTYDDNEVFEGNQLMYVPLHTLRTGCDAKFKSFVLGISANYTGVRETVESGDKYLQLPAFIVFDLTTGFHKEVRQVNLALNFRVDNLLNKDYEPIRSYPTPGRTFHLSLLVGLNKANPEN